LGGSAASLTARSFSVSALVVAEGVGTAGEHELDDTQLSIPITAAQELAAAEESTEWRSPVSKKNQSLRTLSVLRQSKIARTAAARTPLPLPVKRPASALAASKALALARILPAASGELVLPPKYTRGSLSTMKVGVFHEEASVLSKLANFIMKKGNKAKAFTTIEDVLVMFQDQLPKTKELQKNHTVVALQKALDTVKPAFELRKARLGGRTQFIPASISPQKQESQALRWIIEAARQKHKKRGPSKNHAHHTFAHYLAGEFMEAYKNQGTAKNKKDEVHKLAEANRSNAYRRWW